MAQVGQPAGCDEDSWGWHMVRTVTVMLAIGCTQTGELDSAPTTGMAASGLPTSAGTTPDATGPEVCDGIDNDGDGQIDEEGGPTMYQDLDGDLWGSEVTTNACDPGTGWVSQTGDCDDTTSQVYPGRPEQCDGVDNDCNKSIDEGHRDGWYLGTLRDRSLYAIDLGTLTATPRFQWLTGDTGATYNSSDMFEAGVGVAHSNNRLELWQLDVCAETMTLLGPTGVGDMGGVAFGQGGLLFGIQGASDQIMQLNPLTGAASALASIGADVGNAGMAYDCTADTLYALDSSTDALYEIDQSNGDIVRTTPLSVAIGGSNGLEWDHTTGTLLTTSGTTVYRVDPINGDVDTLGVISGVSLVDDLAFFPPCP